MVREVVVEVRLFNSYVGLRERGRWRAVGGGRGWTDLPGILLRRRASNAYPILQRVQCGVTHPPIQKSSAVQLF